MRIIAGILGGRQFDSPGGNRTHPMSEKVRGALFNALGDINGLSVLDAFTGSGALCFEAISRGVRAAVALDIDKRAVTSVTKNSRELGIDKQIQSIRVNAGSWSRHNATKLFDIVLCDSPYDDVRPDLLRKLAQHAKPGGVVVFSLPPKPEGNLLTEGYELLTAKDYGDAQLVFYRRIS